MKRILFILFCGLFFASCGGASDAEKAAALAQQGAELLTAGRLQDAKQMLDSVHHTYPKCVAQRRIAKNLQDSIVYIEAQRTLAYSDSLLQIVQPQADPLLKKFRYEKQEKYEDNGRYVHRLLNTDSNADRCFLQAYVSDDHRTSLRSHYCGTTSLIQSRAELQVGDEMVAAVGSEHHFEVQSARPFQSILSADNDQSLQVLNFVSAHLADRIRVNIVGVGPRGQETNYVYYLSDSEKTALHDTYQLGIIMADIKQLEDAIHLSNLQIAKFEKKHGAL